MRIKRLELDLEYGYHSMHVFHSKYPNYVNDPATLVVIDGKEYHGNVELKMSDEVVEIKITKAKQ